MCLNVAPELAKMILDPTPSGIESISDRDCQIIGRLMVDRDLRARHTEIDSNVKRTSFAVVLNRGLDHDVASRESREIKLKVVGTFVDLCLHGWGHLKIT